jgi:hypothetical protein
LPHLARLLVLLGRRTSPGVHKRSPTTPHTPHLDRSRPKHNVHPPSLFSRTILPMHYGEAKATGGRCSSLTGPSHIQSPFLHLPSPTVSRLSPSILHLQRQQQHTPLTYTPPHPWRDTTGEPDMSSTRPRCDATPRPPSYLSIAHHTKPPHTSPHVCMYGGPRACQPNRRTSRQAKFGW